MLPDIFYIDDGIIHQRTDGDGQTSETHRVDGHAEPVQHKYRDEHRQRKGNKGNYGRPDIGEEKEQDYHYEYGSFIKR